MPLYGILVPCGSEKTGSVVKWGLNVPESKPKNGGAHCDFVQ